MKYLILCFLVLYIAPKSFGQTIVGPIIGYDIARVQSNFKEGDYMYRWTLGNGYIRKSPVFGIKIEQYIVNSFYFSFESSFTHKYIDAESNGVVPLYGIEFDYYQQYFSLRYKIINSIYIGAGVNVNFINRLNNDNHRSLKLNTQDKDNGVHISCGVKLMNLDLEFYFYKSNTKIDNAHFLIFQLEPISSFGVNISYDLMVFNRIKFFDKKALNCPKF